MLQLPIPTTLEQSAQFLLGCIENHSKQNKQAGMERPILLIPSCLGGIVLLKALQIDRGRGQHDGHEGGCLTLVTATRGIIFLATPFRGTAFNDMPVITLKIWAALNDKTVPTLINDTREPPSDLDELVTEFITLHKDTYHVFTFWEAYETSLLAKVYLGWLFSKWAYLACYPSRPVCGFSPRLTVALAFIPLDSLAMGI